MTITANEPKKLSGRHPVNVGHLVMGIAFLGLVGVWALIQTDAVGGDDVRWLLPVPWVLAGLAGLLAIGLSGSKRWSTRQVGWVPPAPEATTDTTDTTETTAETTTETTDIPAEDPTDTTVLETGTDHEEPR
ncbi:hypothetical protein ASC77_19490 [Nocardioides sp. Root1257]|uniref:hypothetical protein n=1 Tax=unclassified Nocardioides TaxID=2615069 RepID=UPI0006F4C829|nr:MULTISPECIES: hypothetical protein [unclassified Nocardioides]KQW46077.1 hypothetical protein ASC77_19490 [Nocardioides sp. Root1257]KRC43339.1 hypothetical protein ASE24_20455 [Nocardioides sp. Root224]